MRPAINASRTTSSGAAARTRPLHWPGIAQVDAARSARGGFSQLLCEAKQQRPLTASCLLRLAAAACQQAPAVTPDLWWISSEQQSEPPASRRRFATQWKEEPVLARFRLTPTAALDEKERPS
jgi:hypothetical protein